ncbi:MAG: ABC transporter ATP-binding protein [Candidatus Peribacteraceae bacterium]|nr:ABC transporter ATP-binding protein [Candidatus Peribacteraceae bacterium]
MRSELSTTGRILSLLKKIHINPAYFIIPIVLSIAAAAFEGVGMSLLIPMLGGFLAKDFSFIKEITGIGRIIGMLPESVSGSDKMLFLVLLSLFVVVIVVKNVLRYSASLTMSYLGTRTVHHLRKQVFSAYLGFGKLFFDRTSVGHHSIVLSQFTTEALQPLLNVDRFIQTFFSLVAYVVVMCLISWKLTLVAVPVFFLLHFGVQSMIRVIRSLSRQSAQSVSQLGKKVVEILSTIPLVKSFNTEDIERRRYTDISDHRARLEHRTNVYKQLIGPLQELITLFSALLLLSGMLFLLVREGQTTAPSFLVYFYLVLNSSNKFGVITGFQSNLANASGPVQEVASVFDSAGKHIVPDGRKTFPGLLRTIEFRDLTFSYGESRHILRNLSFSVTKNCVTALVGPTGTGKTTIVSLLLRLYDCPPESIFLDGIDIRTFTSSSLRSHMAVVSQDTLLLNDTLRANITYGLSDVSESRLNDAVARARLETYVRGLPNGLSTLIGDRGVQLSGGEKQRVSIARALLRNTDILILDEATSSLDSITEKLVQEAINEAIRGKTAIVVAHRLSTIRNAGKIVVIEDGRCHEEGTLEELLQRKGLFHSYWEEQKFA